MTKQEYFKVDLIKYFAFIIEMYFIISLSAVPPDDVKLNKYKQLHKQHLKLFNYYYNPIGEVPTGNNLGGKALMALPLRKKLFCGSP